METVRIDRSAWAPGISWGLAAVFLVCVLVFHLMSALFAGLLVHQIVQRLTPLLQRRIPGHRARWVAVAVLSTAVAGLAILAGTALVAFLSSGSGVATLGDQLVRVLQETRASLPAWVTQTWPVDPQAWREAMASAFQQHAGELQLAGRSAAEGAMRVLLGLILGVFVSVADALPSPRLRPLAQALGARAHAFAETFGRVVFAQVKISALNTLLTGLFLGVALPLFGIHLPLTKTLIVLTFVAGMIPVLGNLISNTAIVLVAFSVSPYVAFTALSFLVVIHKLEYFLNARIVGGELRARAWEVLAAMIVMEAVFGLPGLVAAPVYYGYLKHELRETGWV